jgi:hypothetical protein
MLNIRRRNQTILVHDSSSTPTANAATIPSIQFAPAIADPESSYPPERQAENVIEEPRQGGAWFFYGYDIAPLHGAYTRSRTVASWRTAKDSIHRLGFQ